MAMSNASRRVYELQQQWRRQPCPALERDLSAAVDRVVDAELGGSPWRRARFWEAVEEDRLRLCAGLSEDWTVRDAVKAEWAAAQALPGGERARRKAENARLAELLREYRAAGQRRAEGDALAAALLPNMRKIAGGLAPRYGLPFEAAEEAVQEVFAKWQKKGGILAGWSEAGGARLGTWLHMLLRHALDDLREQEDRHQRNRARDGETDLIGRQPDADAPTQSQLRGAGELARELPRRAGQLAREMVGKTVRVVDGGGRGEDVLLTESHREALEAMARLARSLPGSDGLTDDRLGRELGVSKATAGRRKLAVRAYVEQHPLGADLRELWQWAGAAGG